MSLKKQSYDFRKVKPDDKSRNWLTLSYSARERPSERPNSWEHLQRDFFGFLPTESLSSFTLWGRLSHLPAWSGIFHLLAEVVWWLRLDIFVPIDKFGFFGLFVRVKHPAIFFWFNFEWFRHQKRSDAKYFSSLVQWTLIKN